MTDSAPAEPGRTGHEPSFRKPLIAAGEVLLCSGIPTQLLLLALLDLLGLAPDTETLRPLLPLLIADTALIIVVMVVLMRAQGQRPSEIWLGHRPVAREAMLGVWLIPVLFLIVIVVLNLLRHWAPGLHNVAENPLEQLASGGATDAGTLAVVAIIAGGIREELQRAFLLDRFERHLGGPVVGVLMVSAGFGLGHAYQGWDVSITTGVIGAFWALVYLWRRSCVAPLVSHSGFNAFEVLRLAMLGGSA